MCVHCRAEKAETDFYAASSKKNGLNSWCKECVRASVRARTDPEQNRTKSAEWRKDNPEKKLAQRLSYYYGISIDRYREMLDAQGGGCAICKATTPGRGRASFAVDHDHACCSDERSCGSCVRGLLCLACNQGLGFFRDSPEFLTIAAGYLSSKIEASI